MYANTRKVYQSGNWRLLGALPPENTTRPPFRGAVLWRLLALTTGLVVQVLRLEVLQWVRLEADLAVQRLDDFSGTCRSAAGRAPAGSWPRRWRRPSSWPCRTSVPLISVRHRRVVVATDVEATSGREQRLARRVVVRERRSSRRPRSRSRSRVHCCSREITLLNVSSEVRDTGCRSAPSRRPPR